MYDTHLQYDGCAPLAGRVSPGGGGACGESDLSYPETVISADQPVLSSGGAVVSSDQPFLSAGESDISSGGTVVSPGDSFISTDQPIISHVGTDVGIIVSASGAKISADPAVFSSIGSPISASTTNISPLGTPRPHTGAVVPAGYADVPHVERDLIGLKPSL